MSSLNFAALPLTVRRDSTSLQADSLGVGLNEHFLTYGFLAPSPRSNQVTLNAIYRRQEQEKRRKYGQRVRELEHASFVPLVFTCTGGAGPAATTFLKRLADRISSTHQLSYNEAIVWLRTRLSFALLRFKPDVHSRIAATSKQKSRLERRPSSYK